MDLARSLPYYAQSLRTLLVPAVPAHPAKMAWGLALRLLAHVKVEGWLLPGGVVLDPLAGSGVTGLACSMRGVRSVLGELEAHLLTALSATVARHRACWQALGYPVPLVLGVTVLSSHGGEGLASPASLAWEAKQSGLDGVVVSGEDVRDVRDACGEDFVLAVPGIRPEGSNGHDQVRVLTPEAAIERGADYLIVGRSITDAADPVGVARGILRSAR